MKKFILIIFILGIVLAAAGFWYWQKNSYSKDILKIEILGPNEAGISEEVEYAVKYKNNGNIKLEEPRLIFEFPEYSLPLSGNLKRQEIESEELGDIYPGEEKVLKFKCRLFGKEGDLKTFKAWLNFRPKNLNARYEVATTFTTKIQSVPLSFNFDLPSKIEPEKEFSFSMNYYSSLEDSISDLAIKINYPSGFEFKESKPSSLTGADWEIPLLNKAEGGRIEIKGKLSGQLQERKTFSAQLGIWRENNFILLKQINKEVEIVKPHLSIFQTINGNSQYIASSGDLLHYEIYFRNIGEESFNNLFLVVKLEGNMFDLQTIKTDNGQFKPGDNSIVWDWRSVPKLGFLDQGEEGKIEFWINLKNDWEPLNPQDKNPILKNTVLLSQAKEEFETKVNSKLVLEEGIVFENGIYTVNWKVKNYFNDVKNIKVKTVLSPNVQLTGKIYPTEETSKFSFDNQSREIVWMVGDKEANTGIFNEPPTISFQLSSLGESLNVINNTMVSGEDQWTGSFIISKAISANE